MKDGPVPVKDYSVTVAAVTEFQTLQKGREVRAPWKFTQFFNQP
jgi:hypothetical protein